MEHEIVRSVAAAQKDAQAADALVRQYLPFIKAETAKFLKRIPVEGKDDEFGIAMFDCPAVSQSSPKRILLTVTLSSPQVTSSEYSSNDAGSP